MRLYFQVRVFSAERAVMRILQVLEQQRVVADRFEARQCLGAMHVRFVLTADRKQAGRIGWLLRRSFAVESAHWLELTSPADEQRMWHHMALAEFCVEESDVDLDPLSPWWQTAPSTILLADNGGLPIEGHDTEVRMRWSAANLYLLFDCAYRELHLRKRNRLLNEPTPRLWEHDVAEIFVGTGAALQQRYMEFEVSPRGEWIDLDITAREGSVLSTAPLCSGFSAAAEIRAGEQRWRAFLRIPLSLFAESGVTDLRLNLFRSQGSTPVELAWQPTHHVSFHVPTSFGYLRLLRPDPQP